MTVDPTEYTQRDLDEAIAECGREPVHIPGAIQAFGILLCFDPSLRRVQQVSANVGEVLGLPVAECLRAKPVDLLGKSLLSRLKKGLKEADQLPGALTVTRRYAGESRRLHVAAFRSSDTVVVELEPLDSGTRYRWLSLVNDWIGQLVQTQSREQVLDKLVEAVRDITGFDRCLVYAFDAGWNGQVLAESRNDALDSLLHHHFPSSDIPPQVRALYERNRVRMIADCRADPVPLVPTVNPDTEQAVDLGAGTLRAVSPVHREYMHNMDVSASLSVAIYSETGLWGLVACHSREPLVLSPSARDSVATLVQVASQRLFLIKGEGEAQYRQRIHENRALLARSVQKRQAPRDLLLEYAASWRELFDAQGLAMVYLGEITTDGQVPGEEYLRTLCNWLEYQVPDAEPWSTTSLFESGYPDASQIETEACGLLAMPLLIDMDARGWLLFFRVEQVELIDWAGKPEKGPRKKDDRWVLSPRQSFAGWREEVRDYSKPWHPAEEMAIRDLGDDLAVIASAHEIARLNEHLRRERKALAEANQHLQELANTDALTGIMNRYRIEHLVQMALANAERYGQTFSLLLFDIDYFKAVNDTHGHEVGDRVLKTLVKTLQGGLREADQLGRWGGEEFVILVPNTPLEDAAVFAERLRDRVANADFGLGEPITISIGIAEWGRGDSFKTLLVRADRAMYQAKYSGRNRVCLGTE